MKFLCVNAGSSSLKFQLFEMPEEKVIISGYIEKIGFEDSFWNTKINGEKIRGDGDVTYKVVASTSNGSIGWSKAVEWNLNIFQFHKTVDGA